jgi:hypothetical protein
MHYASFLEETRFFLKMCLYMCVAACGFSMMVNLPILHIECAVALTITFWIDGSCSDPPVFVADA